MMDWAKCRFRSVKYLLLMFGAAVSLNVSGCISDPTTWPPVGPPGDSCEILLPEWYQWMPIGETGPEDIRGWFLEHGLIEDASELMEYQEGTIDGDASQQEGGSNWMPETTIERWVAWTVNGSDTVLGFDDENRLIEVDISWEMIAPTLGLTLECLGPPQYYRVQPAHVETAIHDTITLYYPSEGIYLYTKAWLKEGGLSPDVLVARMVIQEPSVLDERMEEQRRGEDPSWPRFREWPGDLESIIVD